MEGQERYVIYKAYFEMKERKKLIIESKAY